MHKKTKPLPSMSIVNAKQVAKGLQIDKLGVVGTLLGGLFMQLTRISTLNEIYDRHKHRVGVEFLDEVLKELGVEFEIPEKDFKRIPKTGPFITVSNHPLGGIDGLILLKLMLEARPDYKIIANFLLQNLFPLKEYIMPVNPFENKKELKASTQGLREAIRHLQEGHPMGMFPAGEVSTEQQRGKVMDRPWTPEAMKLIQRSKVPVVPVYFHAKNSRSFYRWAKIGDSFRTAKLPSEMLRQSREKIKVRIGNPISVPAQQEYEPLVEYTEFLRKKTYMLSSAYHKKTLLENIPRNIKFPRSSKDPSMIAEETCKDLTTEEIEYCRANDFRLLKSKNYEVFLAQRKYIPNIILEIGRLREITFREVGEGTNKAVDLDKYDDYYHHLFLYDNQAQTIVGAYRMGLGSEIFSKYGMDGFYLNELFRFEPELDGLMQKSIEMGRAFIVKEYQQRPMPLFLLWKGIVHCTLRFPEHKYLIGGVSISNKFSIFSKSIMVEFMKSHYYDPYVAQYIRPKKEFKVKLKDGDKDFVFDESKADLNKFDKILDELEPDNLRMPVLLKKYIKQNAKVVAFNVDPLFNNAVDGLMYIRIADLPESTVKPVMEEFQEELERKSEK